ncbi:hypothetical protein ACFYKX_11430 [Cytobacillus sp. FJAT-54145]|uniref:Uncharacterized protein n=1 Tax=Cytobacillus spartinae TaxID=3299023 RepID=A0ABW6KES6_9BACI
MTLLFLLALAAGLGSLLLVFIWLFEKAIAFRGWLERDQKSFDKEGV